MRRRLLPLVLVLACVVGVGQAQVPPPPAPVPALSISGATEIPFYGMAILELIGAHASSTMWDVDPEPTTEDDNGQITHFTGPPGRYKVKVYSVVNGTLVMFKTYVQFLPDASPPGPAPPPGPGPLPPPGPSPNPSPTPTGNVWAIAIFDTSQQVSLSAGQLAIYGSPTISGACKAIGAIWRRYDVNDKIPKAGSSIVVTDTNWGHAAAAVGWPALVFTDSTGVIVHPAQKLPVDEPGVVAAVKVALGK